MQERYVLLKDLVRRLQKSYHFDDAPEVSDEVYDSLVAELKELEVELDISEADRVSNQVGYL